MRKLLAVAAVVLAIYTYLALHAPKVFDVLVYHESELMPRDIEPVVVSSIVKNMEKVGEEVYPVVIFGPDLEEKARFLSRLYPSAVTPWTILDKALELYWENVWNTVDNYTSKFREAALQFSNATEAACRELAQLESAYSAARAMARQLLLATYGVAALGKAVDNKSDIFLEAFRQYVASHDVDTAVRMAADVAYGNVSAYLKHVTWKTWGSEAAVDNVTEAILITKLNMTLINLAKNVSIVGVKQYIYVSLLNKTPHVLKPYLPYLICGGDVDRVVSIFREELVRNITSRYPLPNLFSVASSLVYQQRYALAFVRGHINSTSIHLGVPVSSSFLLQSFTQVVVEDVSKIDKATALALFAVLLYIMGTVAAPVAIISTIGLTYLSLLGFLYQISEVQKIYYLTIYMAAPVVFAIGVDYMLLMASRYAEERGAGRGKLEAVASVLKYARRAISASAAAVAASLGSFVISTLPFMQTIGVGYLITTAFIVATVFVVFPSLLYILGDRLFWPKKTVSLHSARSRLLETAVSTALGRPLAVVITSAAVTIIAFIFLVTTLNVTANPVVAMPETEHKKALEVATTYFPNVTALSTTYVVSRDEPAPGLLEAIKSLPHYVNHTVESVGEWHVVSIRLSVEDTSDELLEVYRELDALRSTYGPFLIGGAASWKDVIFNEIYVKFWNVQIYIIILAIFIILSLLLKSFLIPLRLIATILMSTVWSLAVEVLIFQEALGQPTYWLVPIVLFAFLMAVGTDYDIFIVTRIREELEGGATEREAIKRAIVATGPVITGAAVILAAAFSTLLLSQTLLLRQVGFTIALAALVDAFVIRPFVVPAIMVLAGRYNWLWIAGYSIKQSA